MTMLGNSLSPTQLKTPVMKQNWHLKAASQATIDVRLKAICECLILSGAGLDIQDSGGWGAVHVASKSFNLNTIRWMLSVNKVLCQLKREVFDFE